MNIPNHFHDNAKSKMTKAEMDAYEAMRVEYALEEQNKALENEYKTLEGPFIPGFHD